MDLDRIAREAAEENEAVSVAISFAGLRGGWRDEVPYYPASVIKLLFFEYALAHFPSRSSEFERALRDMIVDSSNDATALVVDTITETTGGPELDASALREWMERRQIVNRWYGQRGFHGLNACQKTWNEAPYGRERQGYGPQMELRNALTARLSLEILESFLQRFTGAPPYLWRRSGDPQFDEYLGGVAPEGWQVASKAGWTSEVRHDLALFLPPGRASSIGLAVFTRGFSAEADRIPSVGRRVLSALGVDR